MKKKIRELSKNIKVKTRITILVLVIIVPLTSLYASVLRSNYDALILKRTENTENAANLVSSFFNNIFTNIWYLQETSAVQIKNNINEHGEYEDIEFIEEVTRALIDPLDYVDSVIIFNNFGEYKLSVSKSEQVDIETEKYSESFIEKDIYKKILNGENRILSNQTAEIKNGSMYIASAVDGNNFENEIITVYKIDLHKFQDETFKGYHIDYGTFGLINDEGEIVYDQSMKIDIFQMESVNYYEHYDESVSLTVDIADTGWKIYSEGFIEKYRIELEDEISTSVNLFTIVAALIVLICIELSKYIIGGAKKLKEVADEVAKNNKKARTNMKAGDEIGQVGRAIDLMLDQLEAIDKERNCFSILMAHEVRTPLNVVYSAIQFLEEMNNCEAENGEKIHKYCGIIKENCHRLNKLVNNIFMATNIAANEFQLEKQNVEIVSCIEDFIGIVSNNIKVKNIQIIFDTECETSIISCDYKRINNLILNILSNSIKFSDDDSTIFVNLKDTKKYIEIIITDEGKGISNETINKVFNSYENAEDILNRTAEGMGLGLYIAKGIVDSHKGDIEIESNLNEGTKVTIKLPKEQNENEEPLYVIYDEVEIEEKVRIELSDIYLD